VPNVKEVRIKELDGARRTIGEVEGTTFRCRRSEKKHLFLGGHRTLAEALKEGRAAWGLDLGAMEGLAERGVTTVEIRTPDAVYRARMTDLLSEGKSFVHTFRSHRPQTFLALKWWTKSKK